MAIKISKKIKGYAVVTPDEPQAVATPEADEHLEVPKAEVIQMHERIERPDVLVGSTYKIKSPLFEHALYVTINDIVLNHGTDSEQRRPFEIFINSKNMDHFQWIVALTRIMSAVFRKGGDVTFLVEEMKAVFDPRGGYFKAGGVYMPSIVAEIGAVVEHHLKSIGLLRDPELSPEQKHLIAEKRAAYERSKKKMTPDGSPASSRRKPGSIEGELAQGASRRKPGSIESDDDGSPASSRRKPGPSASSSDPQASTALATDLAGAAAESAVRDAPLHADSDAEVEAAPAFPPGATHCAKCSTQAVVMLDGCATCLNCGYSKCG